MIFFSMKKIVILPLELYAQVFFALDKYLLKIWVENSVFAIQHIRNRKSFTEVLPPPPPPPPPRDQTNPFAYCCGFTFDTSYKNGMICHGGGGGDDVKMLKNNFL